MTRQGFLDSISIDYYHIIGTLTVVITLEITTTKTEGCAMSASKFLVVNTHMLAFSCIVSWSAGHSPR